MINEATIVYDAQLGLCLRDNDGMLAPLAGGGSHSFEPIEQMVRRVIREELGRSSGSRYPTRVIQPVRITFDAPEAPPNALGEGE